MDISSRTCSVDFLTAISTAALTTLLGNNTISLNSILVARFGAEAQQKGSALGTLLQLVALQKHVKESPGADPTSRVHRSRKVNFGAAILLTGATLLLASACGDSGGEGAESGNPPALTHQEAEREYRNEAMKWALPSNWEWPSEPIYKGVADDGSGVVYGPDTGSIDATNYWFCAWSRTLISASVEADRATALAQVLRVPETPFYKVGLLSEDKATLDSKLEAARAGDLQPLTATTELNCPVPPQ